MATWSFQFTMMPLICVCFCSKHCISFILTPVLTHSKRTIAILQGKVMLAQITFPFHNFVHRQTLFNINNIFEMHTFYLGKSLLHKSFLYKRCAFTFKLLRLLCQSEDDNVKSTKLTFDILKQGSNSQVCTNVSNTQGLPVGGGMLKFSIDQHIRFMLHLYMLSVSTDSSFLTN